MRIVSQIGRPSTSAIRVQSAAEAYVIDDRSNGSLWYDANPGGTAYSAVQIAHFGTAASHLTDLDHTDFLAM